MLRHPDTAPAESDVTDPDAGRIVAQRGLFLGPSLLVPEDLYARVERGTARRERHRVTVSPGSAVSTNTYFGRFHATYWQRWTAVPDVEVRAAVTGTGRVRLLASDTNKVWRIVDAVEVSGADGAAIRLAGPVDRFVDGGGMWLEITTETGELAVAEVRWTVTPARPPAVTDVTMCTYNRVEDCLNTLTALAADPEALGAVAAVQVVDQGSDPLETRPRFAEVAGALGERLRYVRQPNLGGAGGFTRGMFDATAGDPADDHDVLLMDDDVLLEPEILIRLTAFAACVARPMIVGGQMLNLLHPGHLHISAEYADPERLEVGLPVAGALKEAYLLGLDDRALPINQERRVDTEYNGWWSCLVPAAVVRAIGYPLPLFFQWDDIEYGYRARGRGFPTVALPGAGVWHADFGWKDWDEWHRYFNLRNGLVTAALHTGFTPRRIEKRIGQLLAQYLVAMHYGLAATLLQAVEDFLDGPEVLEDGSVAAAAEIRRIRADYPETVVHPMSELPRFAPGVHEAQVVRAANEPGKERLTWLKRAAYLAAGRPGRRGFVPAGDAHWWHVSTFERAIVTDMGETGFRVRERDRARALDLARRGVRVLRRFDADAPAVAERYRAEMGRLTSRENWARLYGLDGVMRLVLLRHAECLGNVDKLAYTRIPDHALPLTPDGVRQARAAGPEVRALLGPAAFGAVVSPYTRTLDTLALLDVAPAWTVQEPRLREQDWGNLQDAHEQARQEKERNAFGHFFFRLSHGESGADVDDRMAAFLSDLTARPPGVEALLVVTHGLAMRLLARRALGWTVALFESLSNPGCCETRVLTHDGASWSLDRPFAQWKPADDGSAQ